MPFFIINDQLFSKNLFFLENSLLHIICENTDEKKNSDNEKKEETRICLYNDGAIVNAEFFHKRVCKGEEFIIENLSTDVNKDSIMIHPPDGTILKEYLLINNDEKQVYDDEKQESPSNLDKKSKIIKQNLLLKTSKESISNPYDLWQIRYLIKNIRWNANHAIEFSQNMEYITFSTIISIENQSKIDFKHAKIQLFNENIPFYSLQTEQNNKNYHLIYKYENECDLESSKEKKIIWSHAKHVVISKNNGLFVGGKFLEKMNEAAKPQMENWISFPNIKAVGLGKHLPSGKVAIYYNSEGFTSLIGYTEMQQIKSGGDVIMRIPINTNDEEYSFITASLMQENYRALTPSISEAEYRLSLQNLKDSSVFLTITINQGANQKCLLARSNIKYEVNKQGEITWNTEIPAKGSKEIRYKLTIIKKEL
ncbi:MAG: hypothetical protein LBS83_01925 [Holosporales bacterium]|nr:hypothetical protein [Holosporales bacterium]